MFNMNVVKINLDKIEAIYYKYLIHDFSIDEVKPFSSIDKMYKDGRYEAYAYYDNDELVAYAFMAIDDNIVLLDYLACIYRNRGYGSKFISELKGIYDKPLVIECEKIIDNDMIQTKRLHFYLKNGFILTNISLNLYHVDYNILCDIVYDHLKDDLLAMYHYMFKDKLSRVCKFYDQ